MRGNISGMGYGAKGSLRAETALYEMVMVGAQLNKCVQTHRIYLTRRVPQHKHRHISFNKCTKLRLFA